MTPVIPYTPRFVDVLLDQLLPELSAVMLIGPRACGKTTTAARRARSIVHLDDPNDATAFRYAPDAAMSAYAVPVLLDEWQEVPEVLGAVKRAVDARPRPGGYLLTGSVRARRSGAQWPGTGRVVPIEMFGLTVAEISGADVEARFLERLFGSQVLADTTVREGIGLMGHLELALRSGFPEAVHLSERARAAWLAGYVDQLVHHDAIDAGGIRSPERLMAVLRAVALSTAGSPSETSLAAAAGIDVRTLRAHLDLLEDLRVIERIPAWHSSRFTRLVKAPKYYVLDPGLAAAVIGVDRSALMRSGDLLGRVIDTFVASQLRPLLGIGRSTAVMTHLRDRGGEHEVDLVLETRSGEICGIEIKAAGRADRGDAQHLRWLRDRVGDQFRCGVIFHTGQAAYALDDRIVALPIAAIWQQTEASGTAARLAADDLG